MKSHKFGEQEFNISDFLLLYSLKDPADSSAHIPNVDVICDTAAFPSCPARVRET